LWGVVGTTSKPVRILVLDEDLYNSAEVQALAEKGHPVTLWEGPFEASYDLVIGRRAWYLDTKHLKYLEKIAIPSARSRIKDREKAEKTKNA
jgi:hypothetical protein